ncbi:MAG: ATP-binding protein [Candidatus Dojkabacteria bacterium]
MEELYYLQNPWWENREFKKGVERKNLLDSLKNQVSTNRICMLLGGRRVGKTTLMYQYIADLIATGVHPTSICYLLLDTRAFEGISITELLRNYRQIHNLSIEQTIYLFLDEVQYKEKWEQEIKNIYDTERNVTVVLSGSAGFKIHVKTSFLTGRYRILKIVPLNFGEWLEFNQVSVFKVEQYKYVNLLEEYLLNGGYPEYILTKDPQYFSNLVDSIVFKDFFEYFNLKNLELVKDLFGLIADRNGSHSSLTRLANVLGVSKETVRDYLGALKGCFSIYELPRYAYSRNEQIYFPKKYYVNDNGMLFNLTGKFNKGQAVERTVYDRLRQLYPEESIFFYYNSAKQFEADFIVDSDSQRTLVESKFIRTIAEFNPKQLLKVLKEIKTDRVLIVTESLETITKHEGHVIEFVPLWKFLL